MGGGRQGLGAFYAQQDESNCSAWTWDSGGKAGAAPPRTAPQHKAMWREGTASGMCPDIIRSESRRIQIRNPDRIMMRGPCL